MNSVAVNRMNVILVIFWFCKYIGYFLQEEVWIFIWSDVEHVIVIKVKLCLYILYLSNCVRK